MNLKCRVNLHSEDIITASHISALFRIPMFLLCFCSFSLFFLRISLVTIHCCCIRSIHAFVKFSSSPRRLFFCCLYFRFGFVLYGVKMITIITKIDRLPGKANKSRPVAFIHSLNTLIKTYKGKKISLIMFRRIFRNLLKISRPHSTYFIRS